MAADGPLAIGSIRPQPGTRFMGEIRSPPALVGVVSGDGTYLGVRYLAEGFRAGDLIKVMLKGADGADYHGFVAAESGGWHEAVLRLDGSFVDLEHGSAPLRPGVAIAQLVFLGAAPDTRIAPAGPRLWLDEVVAFTAPGKVDTLAVEQK